MTKMRNLFLISVQYLIYYLITDVKVCDSFTFQNQKNTMQHQISLPMTTSSSSSDSDKNENTSTRKKMLGIITFDLDDTLFPIGPVVRDANDAMFSTLIEKYGFRDISEDQYLQACKTIRKELYNLPQEKKITYTELRKRAVSIIVQQSEFFSSDMDPQEISNEAFEVWLDERQSSANMNLFSEVIPAFDELQKKYPSATIAAITNGRVSLFTYLSSLLG